MIGGMTIPAALTATLPDAAAGSAATAPTAPEPHQLRRPAFWATVGVVLEVTQPVGDALTGRRLHLEKLGQLTRGFDEQTGRGGEEREKAGVLGCEAKTH